MEKSKGHQCFQVTKGFLVEKVATKNASTKIVMASGVDHVDTDKLDPEMADKLLKVYNGGLKKRK